MVILEEGKLPHPWCPLCDMLVPWSYLSGHQNITAHCKKGAEGKQRQMAAEEEKAVTSRAFNAYWFPLGIVTYFRYLGRVILTSDDDWLEVIRNLGKAREVWKRMVRILSGVGARPHVYRFFFKDVVQSVLLFGAETWVMNPCMGWALRGFQDQVERRLMGNLLWKRGDGKWDHTSADAAREEVGLETMETYIWKKQNTVAQYIATLSLLDLCEATESKQGAWVEMQWW